MNIVIIRNENQLEEALSFLKLKNPDMDIDQTSKALRQYMMVYTQFAINDNGEVVSAIDNKGDLLVSSNFETNK